MRLFVSVRRRCCHADATRIRMGNSPITQARSHIKGSFVVVFVLFFIGRVIITPWW